MAHFFGRIWKRAQGKSDIVKICDKVFNELADVNTKLLDIDSLHVATLMVYNTINKRGLAGNHKDPPSMKVITEKMERYHANKAEGITQQEFEGLILEWVKNHLRLLFPRKVAATVVTASQLAVTAKSIGRKVPRIKDAVEKVPTPLLFTIFSVGLMLMPYNYLLALPSQQSKRAEVPKTDHVGGEESPAPPT